MIAVNMHEAKTRLSELVKAVEELGETVILHRNGKAIAEIRAYPSKENKPVRDLTPDPAMCPLIRPGYEPAEPLSEDEWPESLR
ncbi:MAG TPA: type II toxin-antitoxin system Phd/YefM family antitoxin [Candidatus Methylacidiphilales bacterium]|nr:type II toxin-antitoxin system Phd/YefM family antitoxin [Candidatus Methylacidiphilales bacterium]